MCRPANVLHPEVAKCHVLASNEAAIQAEEAMLAGLIHNIGVLPLLVKAEQKPDVLQDAELLNALIQSLSAPIGVAILKSWDFPDSLVTVVAEHQDLRRDSGDVPDLVDIVQVANLQSHFNTTQVFSAEELEAVPAFRKLGIQTDVDVVELDENSEEYAQAMALFR